MKIIAAIFGLAFFLLSTSCYNNPRYSDRTPGQGNAGDSSRGPSVGPGMVEGGSTAGPQPAAAKPANPTAQH